MNIVEAHEVMAMKIHQGQRSWPAWMEAACVLPWVRWRCQNWSSPGGVPAHCGGLWGSKLGRISRFGRSAMP